MPHDGLEVVGEGYRRDSLLMGAEYLKSMNPDVLRMYDDLGMSPEFTAIMSRHLDDITLAVPAVGHADLGTSYLTVKKFETDEDIPVWRRVAVISSQQIRSYSTALGGVLRNLDIETDVSGEKVDLDALAFDWVFFELTADVAANSYLMQQMYDGYIADWNGQAQCYLAQYSISRAIFSDYASNHDDNDLVNDHANFKSGVALALLADDLLFRKVVDGAKRSQWVAKALRHNYPVGPKGSHGSIFPLEKQCIVQRLINLEPRSNIRESMAEFARLFIDELLEEGDDDEL